MCCIMMFVALWCLSQYDICCIMMFVAYDVCHLWHLSPYDVCRIMTFVASWRLSPYDFWHIMRFVALWCLSFMTFVVLWSLSHYDLCRQLWRLWLIVLPIPSHNLFALNLEDTYTVLSAHCHRTWTKCFTQTLFWRKEHNLDNLDIDRTIAQL